MKQKEKPQYNKYSVAFFIIGPFTSPLSTLQGFSKGGCDGFCGGGAVLLSHLGLQIIPDQVP